VACWLLDDLFSGHKPIGFRAFPCQQEMFHLLLLLLLLRRLIPITNSKVLSMSKFLEQKKERRTIADYRPKRKHFPIELLIWKR
jgi:hypothetical protein